MTQFVGFVRVQHLAGIGVEDNVGIGRGVALLLLALPLMHAVRGAVRSMARGRRVDCDGNGESADSTDGTSVITNPFVPTWMIYSQLRLQAPVLKALPTRIFFLPLKTGGTMAWSNVTTAL